MLHPLVHVCPEPRLGTAWLAATQPGNSAARLGLATSNAGGINEVRAQYAGFFLAVSLVCIATLFGGLSRQVCRSLALTITLLKQNNFATEWFQGSAANCGNFSTETHDILQAWTTSRRFSVGSDLMDFPTFFWASRRS